MLVDFLIKVPTFLEIIININKKYTTMQLVNQINKIIAVGKIKRNFTRIVKGYIISTKTTTAPPLWIEYM